MTNRLNARKSLGPESKPAKKIDRVEAALRHPAGLNRFQAEQLGDHCLNSTIAALRAYGCVILSKWETVPTRYCVDGVRVKRYWIAGGAD